MDRKKTNRLNLLFEKMTVDSVTAEEQVELKALYQEYVYEGRDSMRLTANSHTPEKRYSTSKS